MRIALAGNPNSGKTTLYNAITGQSEDVGNWSGVTIDKKEAPLKKSYNLTDEAVSIVDLPGAYSISPYSGEEVITRDAVKGENIDVIINIVDGANFSRSLFFTSQLLELGIPVVVAFNKMDILKKREEVIDFDILSKELNCPVINTTATTEAGLEDLIKAALESKDDKQETVTFPRKTKNEDLDRQAFVQSIVSKSQLKKRDVSKVTLSDRIDMIVAHKWLGLPIFFMIMWGVFSLSINGVGGFLSEYFNETVFGEIIPTFANNFFEGLGVAPMLQALIVDGAIGGVGAVVGFLPLIMVLFFCLAILEDSGYMARVAVVMDRFFKRIGLSGKSIIPMIVGSGCAIPGVMATRTIEDINERRMTTILTPFVPCGAKLPIIALFAAVFFPTATWVGPSMYMIAIVMIVLGGLLLKRLFAWEPTDSGFIMELPEYKVPSLKYALKKMVSQARGFIYKATTIILVCNTLVWFAQAYSFSLQAVENQSLSILAGISSVLAPLLIPLGFVGWQLAAATVTGFIAKENVVGTFAVLLLVASEEALHVPGGALSELFTPVTAYAFLVFNLFTPPCFAAIGAMNAELGSKKWLFRALGFQFGVGYTLALLISQFGTLIIYGKTATGFVPAMIVLVSIVSLVIYMISRTNKSQVPSDKLGRIGA